MLKEVIATGKSVDQAIDSGCQELGIARDEAQFEIIDLPRKAFFGLKVVPAKVRVYVELPDPKPVQEAKPPKSEAPRQPRAPRPPKEKSEKAPRPEKEKTPAAPKAPREEKGEEEPIPVPVPQPQEELEPMVPTPELEAKAAAAVAYVTEVLHAMGNDSVEVTPKFTHNGVSLVLTGADLGVVIGRRGETLDALQYLSSLVANRLEGDYLRVTIDSGNYREKREKTLGDLAHKLATTAVRTGRSYTLEPMNPYERRIIHAAVSRVKGATSSSIGEEPNRRVVIKPTVPPEGGSKSGERRSRGGRSRGGRGGRDRDRRGDRRDRGPRPPKGDRAPEERVDRAPRNLDDYPIPPREELPQEEPKPAPAAPKVDKPLEESELGGVLYGKIEL